MPCVNQLVSFWVGEHVNLPKQPRQGSTRALTRSGCAGIFRPSLSSLFFLSAVMTSNPDRLIQVRRNNACRNNRKGMSSVLLVWNIRLDELTPVFQACCTQIISHTKHSVVTLGTLPYYRFFHQNTLSPILHIAKCAQQGHSNTDLVRIITSWRDRKLYELHFIQVAVRLWMPPEILTAWSNGT